MIYTQFTEKACLERIFPSFEEEKNTSELVFAKCLNIQAENKTSPKKENKTKYLLSDRLGALVKLTQPLPLLNIAVPTFYCSVPSNYSNFSTLKESCKRSFRVFIPTVVPEGTFRCND